MRSIFIAVLTTLIIYAPAAGDGLGDFVPSAADLSGFKITEAPEYYEPDNLWDYINGGAPAYIVYGFKQVVTFLEMRESDELEVVVDIYDMGDSLNAYGIYSTERSPEAAPIEVGAGGVMTGNTLYFWQDSYYVKLMAYEETEATGSVLKQLGAALSQKLPARGSKPSLFKTFPNEDRIPRRERYIANDVLGQNFLQRGYRVEYETGEKKYQIVLIHGQESSVSRENLDRFRSFVVSSGKVAAEPPLPDNDSFAGEMSYYGPAFFARKGPYIIGIIGLGDRDREERIMKGMLGRLPG
ncbi:DUF6599 family protein [candidate division KSB1 bacterium]